MRHQACEGKLPAVGQQAALLPLMRRSRPPFDYPYFVGPLPVQFGGLVALMRRASLTSSLIAPVIGSDRPALSVISATTCISLSAQVNEIMSQSLSAS